MMNLFSSFNPITSMNMSLNWMMMYLPIMIMMPTFWMIKSKPLIPLKLFLNKMTHQLKMTMSKINSMNIILSMTIMMIIMTYNMMSLLPSTFSVTSHIMINLSMALTLWLALMKKKSNNAPKLMSNLTPMNTPPLLVPFMVLIELVSLIIQPITLSIRLTANITAGHIMMILISQMYYNMLLPALIMNFLMMMLELGVSIIQAYVFTLLIIMYSK